MLRTDWVQYKEQLWASEWHQLFANENASDYRAKLTWRDRFKTRPGSTAYYNFFSSGEEVLGTLPFNTQIDQILVDEIKQIGSYAWVIQEKLKGGNPIRIDIIGDSLGGWGFNGDDPEYYLTKLDVYGYELPIPIAPEAANLLDDTVLMTKPFFKKGPHSELYASGAVGSQYAEKNVKWLLANAMPALTLPAGGNKTVKFGLENNFDMQLRFRNGDHWPATRGNLQNWRHGDLKDVAYPYVYPLFDKFVTLGGLKND